MKKIILFLSFVLFSSFAIGQSMTHDFKSVEIKNMKGKEAKENGDEKVERKNVTSTLMLEKISVGHFKIQVKIGGDEKVNSSLRMYDQTSTHYWYKDEEDNVYKFDKPVEQIVNYGWEKSKCKLFKFEYSDGMHYKFFDKAFR